MKVQFSRSTLKALVMAVTEHLPPEAEILELSCGRGHVINQLQQLGFAASGTNYSLYEDALPHISIINGVDVTEITTLPDKKYDCVIFSESIQNIADHQAVYHSIRHLLREGGLAVITTPNIMNIKSRLHFLFTGFFKVKWNFIGFDVPLEEAFCYHNHPVHLPVDMYYAHVSGLSLRKASGFNIKLKSLLFYLLFAIPIKLMTGFTVRIKESFLKNSKEAPQLACVLSSFSTLAAERLLLIFECSKDTYIHERTTPAITWHKRMSL